MLEATEVIESKKKGPKWKPLYDCVKDAEIDTVYPWAWLMDITQESKGSTRNIIYRVNKELLKKDKKMLGCIFGKGYKIYPPKEQLTHAEGRKDKGLNQLKEGVNEATNINFANASPAEKVRATQYAIYLQEILRKAENENTVALKKTKESVRAQERAATYINSAIKELEDLKKKFNSISAINE